MNVLFKQITIILFLSLVMSIFRYFLIKDEYPLIKKINKIDSIDIDNYEDLEKIIHDSETPKVIDLEIAKKIYQNEIGLFIDARDSDSFNKEHIANAVNVSYESFLEEVDVDYLKESLEYGEVENFTTFSIGNTEGVPYIDYPYDYKLSGNTSKKYIYVIYCSGKGCSLSEELAFYLYENFQFKNLLIYEGGIPEWKNNQLPIE